MNYKGFVLQKNPRPRNGEDPSWAHVVKDNMPLRQSDFIQILDRQRTDNRGTTVLEQYKALKSESQRRHIDRIVKQLRDDEDDPFHKWTVVSIDDVRRVVIDKSSQTKKSETRELHVILERQATRPDYGTTHAHLDNSNPRSYSRLSFDNGKNRQRRPATRPTQRLILPAVPEPPDARLHVSEGQAQSTSRNAKAITDSLSKSLDIGPSPAERRTFSDTTVRYDSPHRLTPTRPENFGVSHQSHTTPRRTRNHDRQTRRYRNLRERLDSGSSNYYEPTVESSPESEIVHGRHDREDSSYRPSHYRNYHGNNLRTERYHIDSRKTYQNDRARPSSHEDSHASKRLVVDNMRYSAHTNQPLSRNQSGQRRRRQSEQLLDEDDLSQRLDSMHLKSRRYLRRDERDYN